MTLRLTSDTGRAAPGPGRHCARGLRLPAASAPDGLPGVTEQTAAPIRRAFWVDPETDPRNPLEEPVGETAMLRHYLERYRMTFEMKSDGLTPVQLAARSVPAGPRR